jgi:hypothetical protein
MREMRRRRRAREDESATGPPFGEDVASWVPDGVEQWPQAWAPPRVEETTSPAPVPTIDVSAELVRLLEVVTTMCDHMIGFVEADREDRRLTMQTDREERRAMIETLSLLINRMGDTSAIPAPPRERVIGGSMPAGPATAVDLRDVDNDELGAAAIQQGGWSAGTTTDGAHIAESADDEDPDHSRTRP